MPHVSSNLTWDSRFQALWKGKTGSFATDKSTGSMVWPDDFILLWDKHAARQVALDSAHLCVICQDKQMGWVGISQVVQMVWSTEIITNW